MRAALPVARMTVELSFGRTFIDEWRASYEQFR